MVLGKFPDNPHPCLLAQKIGIFNADWAPIDFNKGSGLASKLSSLLNPCWIKPSAIWLITTNDMLWKTEIKHQLINLLKVKEKRKIIEHAPLYSPFKDYSKHYLNFQLKGKRKKNSWFL